MKRYVNKFFLVSIIIIVAGSICNLILLAIVNAFDVKAFYDLKKYETAAFICGSIVAIIAIFVQRFIMDSVYNRARGLKKFDISNENDEVSNGLLLSFCVSRLKENKKIKSINVILIFFAEAAIFIATGLCMLYFGKKFFLMATNKDAEPMLGQLMLAICTLMISYSIVMFFERFIFILRRTCFKCGAFYSFVEYNSDLSGGTSIQTRTVDKDVKVGEIRMKSNNEKVGSVYKSVKEGQERTVTAFTEITFYKCHYCNKKVKGKEVDGWVSNWK